MTRKQKRLTVIARRAGLPGAGGGADLLRARPEGVVLLHAGRSRRRRRSRPASASGSAAWSRKARCSAATAPGCPSPSPTRRSPVTVTYAGILPDLFREGQGIIAEGTFGADGVFVADTVLAKHDENYMPKEVVDSLKAQGRLAGTRTAMTGLADRRDSAITRWCWRSR